MTLIRVQPDTTYSIVEENLRFTVPAEFDTEQLAPLYGAKEVAAAIEVLEKHRGWRHIESIPNRVKFCGTPCCTKIALGLPGQPVPITFKRSNLQVDTDDAHNFGELSDPVKRREIDGKADWVAVVHFWEPDVLVSLNEIKEHRSALGEAEGFVSPENMPDMTPNTEKAKKLAAEQKGGSVWLPRKMLAAEDSSGSRGTDQLQTGS